MNGTFENCEMVRRGPETREEKADRLKCESGRVVHASDCATSIAPAEEPGPCDCAKPEPAKQERVRTSFIQPPIPMRAFDWVAWLEDKEESGPYGYGRTEHEAKNALAMEIEEIHK